MFEILALTVKLYKYCSQCSERGYGFQDFSLKNQMMLMFTVYRKVYMVFEILALKNK